MSLPEELDTLTKALAVNPRLLRQYVTRIPVGLAIKFITDCVNHEELPAVRLRALLEEYYSNRDRGAAMELGDYQRKIVDAICRETGKDREGVITALIEEYGLRKLNEIKAASKELDKAV